MCIPTIIDNVNVECSSAHMDAIMTLKPTYSPVEAVVDGSKLNLKVLLIYRES